MPLAGEQLKLLVRYRPMAESLLDVAKGSQNGMVLGPVADQLQHIAGAIAAQLGGSHPALAEEVRTIVPRDAGWGEAAARAAALAGWLQGVIKAEALEGD